MYLNTEQQKEHFGAVKSTFTAHTHTRHLNNITVGRRFFVCWQMCWNSREFRRKIGGMLRNVDEYFFKSSFIKQIIRSATERKSKKMEQPYGAVNGRCEASSSHQKKDNDVKLLTVTILHNWVKSQVRYFYVDATTATIFLSCVDRDKRRYIKLYWNDYVDCDDDDDDAIMNKSYILTYSIRCEFHQHSEPFQSIGVWNEVQISETS